jgi:hypothetical protein
MPEPLARWRVPSCHLLQQSHEKLEQVFRMNKRLRDMKEQVCCMNRQLRDMTGQVPLMNQPLLQKKGTLAHSPGQSHGKPEQVGHLKQQLR